MQRHVDRDGPTTPSLSSNVDTGEDSDSIASVSTTCGGKKRARRSHASELLTALSDMRSNPAFNSLLDIVLVVDGERFPAHRVVLAAASNVFRAMFTNGFKESEQAEVALEDLDSSSWSLVMDFIYSAEVSFESVDKALTVLEGIRRFQIDSMLHIVSDFLSDNLIPENCCTILRAADKYGLRSVRNLAESRALQCFEQVSLTSSFLDLDIDVVEKMLTSPLLTVRSEVKVFQAALYWLSDGGDGERGADRKVYRDRLLGAVDLSNLSEMDLKLICKAIIDDDCPFRDCVVRRLVEIPAGCAVNSDHMCPRLRYARQITITHKIYGVSRQSGHCGDENMVSSPWACDNYRDLHWRLECWPKGYDNKRGISLSLHLRAKEMIPGFGVRKVKFHMFLVKAGESTAVSAKLSREIETSELIERSWGFKSLIALSRIHDPSAGYVDRKTDSLIVGATVYFLS